jgi:hypothetical protein
MSTEGSTRAILAALFAKALPSPSSSVTGSPAVRRCWPSRCTRSPTRPTRVSCCSGQRAARKEATSLHPFGYGRSRYFYSFVVALVLFSLGSVFALYEGYHKITHPEGLTSPIVAILILVVAIGLETFSFRTAIVESRPLKGPGSWWRFIRNSRSPELPVMLLEDMWALIGLAWRSPVSAWP